MARRTRDAPRTPETEAVLVPPPLLRGPAWALAAAGVVAMVAAAAMFWQGALFPGFCTVFLGLSVLGGTLPVLCGRVRADHRGLATRLDPAQNTFVPWGDIAGLERRRRLWTEVVVAVRDGRDPVTLGAPVRLRFARDAAFEAAVADLARRADVAARELPDPCRVTGPTAKRILPKGQPFRLPERTRAHCRWSDGQSELSLRYVLYEYAVGQDGGIERARQSFREGPGGPTPAMTPGTPRSRPRNGSPAPPSRGSS